MRRKCDTCRGRPKQSIDRRPAGILKHQRHAVVVARQRDWPRRPVGVKLGFERIFVFKPPDATERAFFHGSEQDRRQALARAPVEGDVSPSRSGGNRSMCFAGERRCDRTSTIRIVLYLFGSIAGFRPSLRWLR
jgi:hypothetical protein